MMIESVTGVSGADVASVLDRSAAPTPGMDALAREFAEVLAQAPSKRPIPEVGAESTLGMVIHEHEKLYHGFARDLRSATQEIQGMTQQEASMKQIEMMFRAAEVHAQHTAFSSIAQSVKNGVQTLIKNQ